MTETLFTETDHYDTYCIAVRDAQKPTRIDTFITESVRDISRSKVKQLIERGLISVNGSTEVKPSYKAEPQRYDHGQGPPFHAPGSGSGKHPAGRDL
ncbi:MAG: S4 domain-containing protein [Candidatus Marinimicrobia bacterium]|nr:S4 domain-containing protein [Candidatus Neomarinimicrobiota bacterium]